MRLKTLIITQKKIELLNYLLKRGSITTKSQKIYTSLAFRLNIWYFRDRGLVVEDGFKGREKQWRLTKKGRDLAREVLKIREILLRDA